MSTPFTKSAASASSRQARSTLHVASKLIAAVAGSSNRLMRIAAQQQHLALIFQGVSDCLFLLQVEADDCYRLGSGPRNYQERQVYVTKY